MGISEFGACSTSDDACAIVRLKWDHDEEDDVHLGLGSVQSEKHPK